MNIGRASAESGISAKMIRYYESIGLVPAASRTNGGYREYSDNDGHTLRFIRRAQAMGLTLEDIQELLRAQTLKTADQCRRVAARLRSRVDAVDEKIAELRSFRAELVRNLRRCEKAGAEPSCCPVVLDLVANGKKDEDQR